MARVPDTLMGTIVGGPTPEDDGNVTFRVKVQQRLVTGVANCCVYGFRGDESTNPSVRNAVIVAVSRYAGEHREAMPALYREAARLRRGAGNPPLAGNTRRGRVQIIGPPVALQDGSALFTTMAAGAAIKVVIFRDGGFIDHCDYAAPVTDDDRDEAFAVCLDHVLSHPAQVAALGLDLDLALLAELWR
jgi:hypothetical protein